MGLTNQIVETPVVGPFVPLYHLAFCVKRQRSQHAFALFSAMVPDFVYDR
jgi:hypothetical protein